MRADPGRTKMAYCSVLGVTATSEDPVPYYIGPANRDYLIESEGQLA